MQRRKKMEYIVVAFRSREHTVKFSGYLTAQGIPNSIINTPKEAGVGCGLSIKISKERFAQVKRIVLGLSLSSFAGFFLVKNVAGMRVVKSI
jgi:hypothetical protein